MGRTPPPPQTPPTPPQLPLLFCQLLPPFRFLRSTTQAAPTSFVSRRPRMERGASTTTELGASSEFEIIQSRTDGLRTYYFLREHTLSLPPFLPPNTQTLWTVNKSETNYHSPTSFSFLLPIVVTWTTNISSPPPPLQCISSYLLF